MRAIFVSLILCVSGSAVCRASDYSFPVQINNEIANAHALLGRSPLKALRVATDLRSEAATLPNKQNELLVATADWISAGALGNLNRPREAMAATRHGLTIVLHLAPGTLLHGNLVLEHATASLLEGKLQDALNDYQSAYRIFIGANAPREEAVALEDIAVAYLDARDYTTALRYVTQALETFSGEPLLALSAHNNAGSALIQLARFQQAEAEYRLALRAAMALNSPLLTTRVLCNIARSQADAGELADAGKTLKRAFEIAASGPAASWRPALYGVAAQVAFKQRNLDRAERLIERAFTGDGTAEAAMPMRDYYQTAYEISRARGEDAKALHNLESFKRLDDQARALAASTSAALMSARFDFANQDLKITRLRAGQAERDAAIARARARLHTTVALGVLAAAMVISTLLGIGFVSIRRSRNQVRAANATLHGTNADLEKALAAKTEFLATTSHEIRTPLNGILGMTQVILADRATPAPLRERVQLIHGSGETMRALVDDILDVAKMASGELRLHPAEMDLPRLLRDAAVVWAGQAETKGIAIEPELNDCPQAIVADEVRLRQIVFNLMSNAVKFTDQGLVRLAALCETRGGEERLVIRIADSGIGIPGTALDEIFESFKQADGGTTRRHGGTGLGLAICRNLAQAMGGDVKVESVVGTGSTFTVDLPLIRAALAPASVRAHAAPLVLSTAAVLVVEANPLSQGILRALLGPQVRDLAFVAELEAAMKRLEGGEIDHVVADGASLGLDVDAAGRLARAADVAGARLSLMWPVPDAAMTAAIEAAGITQLIAKPIAAPDLLAALRMIYDRSSAVRDIAA